MYSIQPVCTSLPIVVYSNGRIVYVALSNALVLLEPAFNTNNAFRLTFNFFQFIQPSNELFRIMPKLARSKKQFQSLEHNVAKNRKRRHIEDIPFYRLHHDYDDLPLDPARPFIVEKIREYLPNIFFLFLFNKI